MKHIEQFINEKLVINKNIKIDNNSYDVMCEYIIDTFGKNKFIINNLKDIIYNYFGAEFDKAHTYKPKKLKYIEVTKDNYDELGFTKDDYEYYTEQTPLEINEHTHYVHQNYFILDNRDNNQFIVYLDIHLKSKYRDSIILTYNNDDVKIFKISRW